MYLSALFTRYVSSQTLPKQLFSLDNKISIVQTKPLLLISKRTLETNDINEQPKKKSNIALNISNNSIIKAQCLNAHALNQNKEAEFIVEEDGYVKVYVAGACRPDKNKIMRAGMGIYFGDNNPLNVSARVEQPTKLMTEIKAVRVAAIQTKKAEIKKLKINTVSRSLILCITEKMPNWKKNGWKTTGKSVAAKTELLKMEKELESLSIIWIHNLNGKK